MIRLIQFILITLLVPVMAQGQTNISGVINDYTPVSNIKDGGCSVCDSTCSDTLTVGSSSAFSKGDRIMVIQMQGTQIDETNSSTFGDVTDMNNTGNYEIERVNEIVDGTHIAISYLNQAFSTSSSAPPGVVQAVRVPEYGGDVNVNGELNAQDWDGTTGGVLTFIAEGNVTLNADIDVTGAGFRGATADYITSSEASDCPFSTNNWALADPAQADSGALKGEGIASFVTGKERARGNQVNGGGGGTQHNGGGGGGGNVGSGGQGGASYCNCSTTPESGIGEPGAALTPDDNTVFMGGGGGAGHNNTDPGGGDLGTPGEDGSGIILIKADSIINPNHTVSSTTTGPSYDGSGYNAGNSDWEFEIDVLCDLTLDSVMVRQNNASGADVTVEIKRLDPGGTVQTVCTSPTFTIPTQNTNHYMPVDCDLEPGRHFVEINTSAQIYIQSGGAYPFEVPGLIRILQPRHTNGDDDIPHLFNWSITSPCANGAHEINADGIDQISGTNAEGAGGGGAGGSIYLDVNGYEGAINLLATGGDGGYAAIGSCCHAPAGGGGGGVICPGVSSIPNHVSTGISGGYPGETYNTSDYDSIIWPSGSSGSFGGCDGLPYPTYHTYHARPGEDGTVNTSCPIDKGCVLPVDFSYIWSEKQDNTNVIYWSTASERNNDYFKVQRSSDGTNFSSIGTVEGAGTTSNGKRYKFTDKDPLNGTSYYRIKQVDYNGDYSYSRVTSVNNEQLRLNIYPNPAKGDVHVDVYSSEQQSGELKVISTSGRVVKSQEIRANDQLTFKGLPSGVYIIKAYIGGEIITDKFTKQ